jgi:hypothetical protein
MSDTSFIPAHGGYRYLKSFQVAQLAHDVTVRLTERLYHTQTRNPHP